MSKKTSMEISTTSNLSFLFKSCKFMLTTKMKQRKRSKRTFVIKHILTQQTDVDTVLETLFYEYNNVDDVGSYSEQTGKPRHGNPYDDSKSLPELITDQVVLLGNRNLGCDFRSCGVPSLKGSVT